MFSYLSFKSLLFKSCLRISYKLKKKMPKNSVNKCKSFKNGKTNIYKNIFQNYLQLFIIILDYLPYTSGLIFFYIPFGLKK